MSQDARKSMLQNLRDINKNLQQIVRQAQADLESLNNQLSTMRALNNRVARPHRAVILDSRLSRTSLIAQIKERTN